MVEVHPFKPTKDSTFTIWYLVSGRGDGLSIKENDKNPNWNGCKEIPRMESLQAPLSWRTKSFLILQIEHSRSSSSTSLDQGFAIIAPVSWGGLFKSQSKMSLKTFPATCMALASSECVWPLHSQALFHPADHPGFEQR